MELFKCGSDQSAKARLPLRKPSRFVILPSPRKTTRSSSTRVRRTSSSVLARTSTKNLSFRARNRSFLPTSPRELPLPSLNAAKSSTCRPYAAYGMRRLRLFISRVGRRQLQLPMPMLIRLTRPLSVRIALVRRGSHEAPLPRSACSVRLSSRISLAGAAQTLSGTLNHASLAGTQAIAAARGSSYRRIYRAPYKSLQC